MRCPGRHDIRLQHNTVVFSAGRRMTPPDQLFPLKDTAPQGLFGCEEWQLLTVSGDSCNRVRVTLI